MMNRVINRWMSMSRCIDGWGDGQLDGWMARWMDDE